MPDDKLAAALSAKREALAAAWSVLDWSSSRTLAPALGVAAGIACMALDALEAALKFHQCAGLCGLAATEDEPDACPHDPDSPLHFEDGDGSGEWLCEGRPEGAVCSTCVDGEGGGRTDWPCPECAAILAALTGKAASGD
jgi:hypothetical protein